MITTRIKGGGRYPKGYGLPSLVVVLFFVSVLVSAIADAIARETVEARASAAFNGVEERLHAFEVTGGDGTSLLPHLIPSRNVSLNITPPAPGLPAAALVEPTFGPGPEAALFEQQLRAFLNVPAGVPLGSIAPDMVRRKHPERVLRSGDRMGAPIDMNGNPAAPASVLAAGETRSGTGNASIGGTAGLLIGPDGSLFEAPLLTGSRVGANTVELTSDIISGSASIAGSVVAPSVTVGSLQVTGLLQGREATVPDTRVSGSFATDNLDQQDRLYFDQLNVSGIRAEITQANRLSFGELFGPDPGPVNRQVPRVDPDQIFMERP